ncbi:MAG: peptidoglycan-binding protein [Alteromonadaceae bacterium]|nr:MAG: peptidoglycan-binding protein [Alteromonadaceae bacterium]
MPTNHTVQQGETLTRIAHQHGFQSVGAIYDHPDNAELRQLRPDPDILNPGDNIIIPDIEDKVVTKTSSSRYSFTLKRLPKDQLILRLVDRKGQTWVNKRVVMDIGGQQHDLTTDSDGMVTIELPHEGSLEGGNVDIYLEENSEQATFNMVSGVGTLDPVEELSGVQARCNHLSYDCGTVDGLNGSRTRKGVKAFQKSQNLDVDGVPGPITKSKLKQVYGS